VGTASAPPLSTNCSRCVRACVRACVRVSLSCSPFPSSLLSPFLLPSLPGTNRRNTVQHCNTHAQRHKAKCLAGVADPATAVLPGVLLYCLLVPPPSTLQSAPCLHYQH